MTCGRDAERGTRHGRWALTSVAIAVLVAAVLGCGSGDSEGLSAGNAGGEPTNLVGAVVPVGSRPDNLEFADGSIWVANRLDHSLSRVDPDTNEVIATVDLTAGPVGITAGGGSVWVSSFEGTVFRIDPDQNEIADTVVVDEGAEGLAFADGAIWVVSPLQDSVSRIDTETDEVTNRITLDGNPADVIAGDGAIWVLSVASNPGVVAIDPETGEVTPVINASPYFDAFAVVDGDMWITDVQGGLHRYDTKSFDQISELDIGIDNPSTGGITAGAGSIWLSISDEGPDMVMRVDPESNRVTATIPVQESAAGAGPDTVAETQDSGGIAFDGESIWVTQAIDDGGTVTRVNP